MQIKLSDHFTYKKLLRFTLPSVMMMIFTSIYGVVDGFFISNYVGAIPFAAVNLIMPFLMLLATVGFMFGTGGSALVAMLLGRGEKERANGIFSFLVYVLAAVGIIFTVLGFVFLPEVSRMLGASEEMLPYCVMYGRIVLFSLTLFMLQISFQDYLVVAERPKLGFYTTLAAGCTNMLLDAFLVGYLSMGVTGAALATCISETVGGLIPLVYFVMPNGGTLRLGKPYAAFKPLLRAASNGVSEFVSSVSMSFVSILYNFQLIAIAGENGVAAYGIIMYVDFLFMALFIGYSMGISPVISYHYGAQNHMEVRSVLRKSLFFVHYENIFLFEDLLCRQITLCSDWHNFFYLPPNCSINVSSEIIGIPSDFAFLFFDEDDNTSLLIRYVVFEETLPATFPPRSSINFFSSSRFAK